MYTTILGDSCRDNLSKVRLILGVLLSKSSHVLFRSWQQFHMIMANGAPPSSAMHEIVSGCLGPRKSCF